MILVRTMPKRYVALGALVLALTNCGRQKEAVGQGGSDGGGPSLASTPAAAASLAFLNTFEGEIDLAVTNKEATTPTAMDFLVKNGKVRVDLPDKLSAGTPLGGKAYALLDTSAKKLAVVSDARKEVITIDLNTSGEKLKGLGAPPGGSAGGAPQGPKTSLTKTGKFETVAGYKCEDWDITSDHREATACVAEEGASWFQIPLTGIPTERLWMAELFDGKHFPLRVVGYDKAGAETGRLEVTNIQKKSVAATQFEYPPTYRVIDLAELMGAMGSMPGMPGGMPMPGMPPHHH